MDSTVTKDNLHWFLMRGAEDSNIRNEIFWKLAARHPDILMKLANDQNISPEIRVIPECRPENLRSSVLPFIGLTNGYSRNWITMTEHKTVQDYYLRGQKVEAIKALRMLIACGLKDAKDCIESGAFERAQTKVTFSLIY